MAEAKVKITENINSQLKTLFRKLKDPSRALKQIGQLETSETKLRFRNQQDPSGNAWKPLSPFTIARRKKRSNKILLDTGRLRSSITFAVSNTDVFIGTNVIYGSTHQFGNDKKNIPARPFLGVNKQTNENVRSVLKRFLDL